MGNPLLIAGLLWQTAFAEEPPKPCLDRIGRLELLDEAERALVEADLDTTDRKLRQLEAALSCGSFAEAELLGRLWLVEAAWLTMQGDGLAAGDSWRAAARVAPGQWVEDFGKQLRAAYTAATSETPIGASSLKVDPQLFRWVGAIDSVQVMLPAEVTPGLHLLQIGASGDDVRFARMVVAYPSTPIVVTTGIIEPLTNFVDTIVEKPTTEIKPPKEPLVLPASSLYIAAGGALAAGRGEGEGEGREPPFKVVLPLETGFVIRPGGAWFRTTGTAGPLIGGRFQYDDRYGATNSPVALGALLAGGASAGQGDMGLLAGFQFPDRIPVRGVVAGRLPYFPAQIEGRLGMNAVLPSEGGGRPPEVAFDLVFALSPALIR